MSSSTIKPSLPRTAIPGGGKVKANQFKNAAFVCVAMLNMLPMAFAGGFPFNTQAGRSLFAVSGPDARCDSGDITVNQTTPCLTTVSPRSYRFFVEVPIGATNVTVEIFDADVGIGALAEAQDGRDSEGSSRAAAVNSATRYELIDPTGAAQPTLFSVGDRDEPIGGDNRWLTLAATSAPRAGLWEVRITGAREFADVIGDDTNYFGIRACESAATTGSSRCDSNVRDLNVFARSFLQLGNQNASAANPSLDDYTLANNSRLYPWVTHGCSVKTYDFDADSSSSTAITIYPRNTRAAVSLSGFSGNGVWNVEDNDGSDDLSVLFNNQPIDYGMWGFEARVGNDNNNHITVGAGSEFTVAPGSLASSPSSMLANSFRIYLPNAAGVAPEKPRLVAQVTSGGTVADGSILRVNVLFSNPTPYPVVFNGVDELITIPINTAHVSAPGLVSTTQGLTSYSAPALTWNPGTVFAGTAVQLNFEVRLLPGTPATFALTGQARVVNDDIGSNLAVDVNGLRAVYQDETGTRFRFGPLCQLTGIKNQTSTPAVIAQFAAKAIGNRIDVDFSTTVEAGSTAFRVMQRQSDGALVPVSELIAAKNAARFGQADYQLQTRNLGNGELYLQEIATQGKTQLYGPYLLNQSVGREQIMSAVDWQPVNIKPSAAKSASLASQLWLSVDQDGWYRVSATDLAAAGLSINGVNKNRIALSHRGVSVNRWIAGSTLIDADSSIEFFGVARQSLYGKEANYLLTILPADSETTISEPALVSAMPPEGMNLAHTGYREAALASDGYYSFSSPIADPYYALGVRRVQPEMAEQKFELNLPDWVAGSAISLSAELWGGLDFPGELPDHFGQINVGEAAIPFQFDGVRLYRLSHSLTPTSEKLAMALQLKPQEAYSADIVNLDRLQVRYLANLNAHQLGLDWQSGDVDALESRTGSDCLNAATCLGYTISNVASDSAVFQLNARGQANRLLASFTEDGSMQLMAPRDLGGRLVIVRPDAIRKPRLQAAPVAIVYKEADLLIITHANFRAGIERLVQAREAQGMKVLVVDVDQIYAAESGGEIDANAIANWIAKAHARAALKHVLLIGGDQYDYAKQNPKAVSFIPSFYRATSQYVSFAPTDADYTDFDRDGVSDLSIGRIPARSMEELDNLIDKTLRMPNTLRKALVFNDRSQTDTSFAALSTAWLPALDMSWNKQTINMDSFPNNAAGVDAARTALAQEVKSGVALLGFSGHSSPFGWTNSGLLDYARLADGLLDRQTQPTIVMLGGCWGSYHVQPDANTMAHAWLTKNKQGAAALLGSSAIVDTPISTAFFNAMYSELNTGITLGQAMTKARASVAAEYPAAKAMLAGMVLLGDPSLSFAR